MDRRTFVAAAACGLVPSALAKKTHHLPVVGILHTGAGAPSMSIGIFVEGLRKLGYVAGRNIVLDIRSGAGKPDTLPTLANELVRLDARVIIAVGPAAVRAARAATSTIPIVAMDMESDPVEAGFVESLAHPAGNITGLFVNIPEMAAKWLDLLQEMVPGVRRVVTLWDATTGTSQLVAIRAAAATLAIEIVIVEFRSAGEMGRALTRAAHAGADGIVMLSSPIVSLKSRELAAFTVGQRLPGISPFRWFATAGGLLAYGPNLRDFYLRVPSFVDRILKGADPAELPVEQPTTFELVLNVKTAKTLGLTIPGALYASANELVR